jgi:hypothetical protein
MADFDIHGLPVPVQLDGEKHYGNRRKVTRHKPQDALKVQLSIPPLEETIEGVLCDVTSTGAGIMLPVALRRGIVISFRCGTQRIYGTVQHCRSGMEGYRIGVAITDAAEEPE